MSTIIVGVDPGETTGVFAFTVLREADVVVPFLGPVAAQIRGGEGVEEFVIGLLARTASEQRHLAVEQFVVGQRAARSRTPQAGAATRHLIGSLQAVARAHNVWWSLRPAATVKPWATDKRLDAARLLAPTAGMRHARDAARHALYAAVHDGLMRDPLSGRTTSPAPAPSRPTREPSSKPPTTSPPTTTSSWHGACSCN